MTACAAVALIAAACAKGKAPTATSGSSPGSSVTSAPSATTTSLPGAADRCRPSQLSGAVEGTGGAAGTLETTIALRNLGPSSCVLAGYPGIQLVDASGNALPSDVARGSGHSFTDFAAAPVVLAAGQSAYVNLGFSDVPVGTTPCEQGASLWLTPPGDVGHLVIAASVVACDGGRIAVSPVFASGSPASQTTAPPAH
jgi:hypothetical protein